MIAAGTKLCPGTVYYPVFKNNVTAHDPSKTITYTFSDGKTSHDITVIDGDGVEANVDATNSYVMDGTVNFSYSAKSSLGCASGINTFTIAQAAQPNISIVGDSLFCEDAKVSRTLQASSTASIDEANWSWTSPVMGAPQKGSKLTVLAVATSYYVTGTTSDGCVGRDTFTFVQMAKPSVTVVGAQQACIGSKVTLTASATSEKAHPVMGYLWSTNETSASINPVINATTDFTVKAYTDKGCYSDEYDWNVVAVEHPVINFTYSGIGASSQNVCEGDLITVQASVGNTAGTYKWYADPAHTTELTVGGAVSEISADKSTITVKPVTNTATSYYLVADLDGCVSSDAASVKAFALPVFQLSGKTTYCAGNELKLAIKNPVAGVNYYWNSGITSSTSFTVTNVTAADKMVTVLAEDANGCQYHISQPITVNESPILAIDGDAEICPWTSTALTASGADSYVWTNVADPTKTISKSAVLNTDRVNKTATYQVAGTKTSTGCISTATKTVSVKEAPDLQLHTTLAADGTVQFCQGDTAVLLVSGAQSYNWYDPNKVLLDAKYIGLNSARVSPAYKATYRVIGFLNQCPDTLDVIVNPQNKPVLKMTASNDGICSGKNVTMTVSVNGSGLQQTGYTYAWQDDPKESKNEHTVSLTSSQAFTATVTDDNTQCSASVTKTIDVYQNPMANIVYDYSTICTDSIVNLTGAAKYGTAPFSYSWTRLSDPTFKNTSSTYSPKLSADETFSLSVTDAHGCQSDPTSQTILVQKPTVISNVALTNYCSGDEVRISMSGAQQYQYNGGNWTNTADTTFSALTDVRTNIFGRTKLSNYTDKYCTSPLLVVVDNISSAPRVEVTASKDGICSGGEVVISLAVGGTSTYSYNWEGFSLNKTNTLKDTLTHSRTYLATITDTKSGCSTSVSKEITVFNNPTVTISANQNIACTDSVVTLTAVGAGASSGSSYNYTWTRSSDASYKPTSAVITPSIKADDIFKVIASDAVHGCQSLPAERTISVQKSPVVKNTAKTLYCDADPVHLYLTGAESYFVDNKALSKSDTSMALTVGNHHFYVYGRDKLEGTNKYCRSAQILVADTVMASPIIDLVGSTSVCSGAPLELTADVTNVVNKSDLTYYWSEDPKNTTNKLSTYISTTRDIAVTVTQKSTGCSSRLSKQYAVWANPVADIQVPEGDLVCAGSPANLLASATPASDAYSYHWSRVGDKNFSETTKEIYPTMNTQDVFKLVVNDANGCHSDTVTRTIKVQAKPVVTFTGETTLCQGSTLKLNFNGAQLYYVDNGDALPSNVYSESMTSARTHYYQIVGVDMLTTGARCASEPISVNVEVKENPEISLVSGRTSICEGEQLSLKVAGATSYTWNTSDNDPAEDVFTLTPKGSADGTYYYSVVGANANGCKSTRNFTITTLTAPTFNVKASADGVCSDQQVKLWATPEKGATDSKSWTYIWTGGKLTGATGDTVSTLVSGATTFTAVATNAAGCTDSQKVKIAQYEVPVLQITSALNSDSYKTETVVGEDDVVKLCANDHLRLFAAPTATSTNVSSYNWDNGTTAGQVYYPGDTIKGRLNYSHTVVGVSAKGCKASRTVNVEIQAIPVISLNADLSYCLNDSIRLLARPIGLKYVWPDFGDTIADNITTPASQVGEKTYTLYGFSAAGCKATYTTKVTILDVPQFTVDATSAFICQGESAILSVTPDNPNADYDYYWSNSDISQVIKPSPAKVGVTTYTVTVTDNTSNCEATAKAEVTVNERPKLQLASGVSDTVCRGSELSLVAEGANEYYWTVNGEEMGPYYNDQMFITAPTVSSTYVLSGVDKYAYPTNPTDTLRCTASIKVPITVATSPSINIVGNEVICYGDSVHLIAKGIDLSQKGASYVWDGYPAAKDTLVDKFSAQNGQSVVYTVTGTSANGCTGIATKTVTMRPKSLIHIKAKSPVCEGAIASAKASGSNIISYRWSTNEMGDSIAHVIADTITYYVTATDSNQCKVSDSATIIMQPKFKLVNESKASSVCAGSQIGLVVSGASSYVWNGDPTKNQASIVVAPTTDQIYNVVGTYGVCSAALSIPVKVNAAPVISIQGDGSVCLGDSVKLSPFSDSKDVTYSWSGAAAMKVNADNSVYVSPRVATKITLMATSSSTGCTGSYSTTVTVNNLPKLKISGDVQPCTNTYTDLSASGAMSYIWTQGKTTVSSDQYNPYVADTNEVISLWGVDENGCKNTIYQTIQPTQRPVFTIDGAKSICAGTGLQLSAINNLTACYYVWDGVDTTNTYNKVMKESGTYNIVVEGVLKKKAGCSSFDTVPVIVRALPELYITGNDYPCENTTMTVTGHGADKYVWSNAPSDTSLTGDYSRDVTSPAPFSVQLSGWKNGCRADSVFTFKVHSSPLVAINGDKEACKDGVVTLTATSPDATTFDWGTDGAGSTITPVITESKTFKVSVIDKNKCVGSASYKVSLVSSPTIRLYASKDYSANSEVTGDNIDVCSGDALTLLATGAKTWKWTNALESSDSATYIPAATTTAQTVSLTGYLGSCQSTKVFTISILEKPNPWIDGSKNVCEGDTVKLTAMGANHYEWSGVSGVRGVNKDTLIYKLIYSPVQGNVKAIADNGCYTNVPFSLTFTPAPTLNVASVDGICAGASAKLSVIKPDSNYVYVWNDNFSADTFTYRSVTPGLDTVKVQAKVRGLGGCTTTKYYEITTHQLPYVSFSADGDYASINKDSSIQMCAGTDLTVVPLGAKHYRWMAEGLDSMANTMLLNPQTNTVYAVTGTDEYGCSSERDIIVKVNASPVMYSTTYGSPVDGRISTQICKNDSVTLDIAGADSYSWFNGAKTKTVTVKPEESRTYTVTGVKSSTACPASVEFYVKVNALPEVLITDKAGRSGKASLCHDSQFKLYASGASKYTWYDASNSVIGYKDSLADYVGDTTFYTVVGVDSNKCKASNKFTVNSIALPTIYFEPAKPTVCAGASTTIYGRGNANTWFWMFNKDTLAQKSSYTATPTADVTYTLYGSNKFGCTNSVDVPVTVFTAPTIWVDGYSAENGVSDSIHVCKYQDVTLSLMGDAASYKWPSGSTSNSISINDIQLSQNYYVTGIGANGCTTALKIPVSVLPTAVISIKGDQYVCDSSSTMLTAVADSGAFDNFMWSNNMLGTENQIYVYSDTTVKVTGYNSTTGCSNSASFNISMKALPVLGYQGNTDICKGASSVIYATGANTYLWQDGTTGDAYVSKPVSNDIYKVIGTLNGCSDSLFIPITVKIAPVIWADGLKPICEGDSLNLVARGAKTYEWSTGDTTAKFKAMPLDSIAYTLTGTAANGCSSTITVPITVRHRPTVTIDGSANVCVNSFTNLDAVVVSSNTSEDGTANKYRWYVKDSLVSTQKVLNYQILNNKTIFKLVAYDPAGCVNNTALTVTSLPLPVLKVTGPDTICNGTVATYFANGASSYRWIDGKDTVNSNVFKVSPATDAVYSLRGTSAMGCVSDTVIQLAVNQLPSVNVIGSTSVCRGSSLKLIGSGAKSYVWSDGTSVDTFKATPVATSQYQITGTDANGCSNTYKFTIKVNELPKFSIQAQTGICSGETDTLRASSDVAGEKYSYFWVNNEGTSLSGDTVMPVITKATTFKVTANNDSTSCRSSQTINVDAYALPVLSYIGKDSICLGDTVTIIAQGADTKSYTWSNDGQVISNSPMLKFSPSGSTQIWLTGSIAKCSAKLRIPVTVVVPPYLYIATKRDTVCRGSNITMLATGANKYSWSTGDSTAEVTTTPVKSTVYTVTGSNAYGCVSSTNKVVTVIDLPVVKITASKNYACPTTQAPNGVCDSVSFKASSVDAVKFFTWTSPDHNYEIERYADSLKFTAGIKGTTTVILTGTDAAGCEGVDSFIVKEREPYHIVANVTPGYIDNDSRKIRLVGAYPEDGSKWNWTITEPVLNSVVDTVSGALTSYTFASPIDKDSFMVTVRTADNYGCVADSDLYVYKWREVWAADVFTPNADGLNDRFYFRGKKSQFSEFHYVIYNRLGEIVYEGDKDDILGDFESQPKAGDTRGWDGTYKGQPCPWGVYGYTLTYKSDASALSKSGKKRGTVTIIR